MGKKVLFITQRKLLPLHDGALICSAGFLKFLKLLDAEIDCVSFYDTSDYSEKEKKIILQTCKSLTSIRLLWKSTALNISMKYPNSIRKYTRNSMRRTIQMMCKLKSYDVIVIDHLQMAEYITDASGLIKVMNEHNVETEIWENYSIVCNPLIKPFVKNNARRMRKYESDALSRFDYVLSTTDRDKDNLLLLNPQANIKVMHPYSWFDSVKDENSIRKVNNSILFVGSYGWYPNQNAATFLIKEVMPLLRVLKKKIRLYLVGKDPTHEMLSCARDTDDIIVTGQVESTDEYYRICDLFINPIDDGSGVNIKMLEAMGKGIPIITSKFGLRGFNSIQNEVLSIFDNAKECANLIVELLNDENKRIINSKLARDAYLDFIEPSEEIKRIFL